MPTNVVVSPDALTESNTPGHTPTGILRISQQVGASFYLSRSNGQLMAIKTLDSGETWGTPLAAPNSLHIVPGVASFSCWFDRQTPGNNGTLVHFAYFGRISGPNPNKLLYATYDILTGAWSSSVLITSLANTLLAVSDIIIVQTRGLGFKVIVIDSVSLPVAKAFKSLNGLIWISISSPFLNQSDRGIALYGYNPADPEVCAILRSPANGSGDLFIDVFDDLNGNWVPYFLVTVTRPPNVTLGDILRWVTPWGMGVQRSNNHTWLLVNTNPFTNLNSIRMYELDINTFVGPVITQRTNVLSNAELNSTGAAVYIEQTTNKIFAMYLRGISEESLTFPPYRFFHLYYKYSTDQGLTWSPEIKVDGFSIPFPIQTLAGGASSEEGAVFQPTFYDALFDILYTVSVAPRAGNYAFID